MKASLAAAILAVAATTALAQSHDPIAGTWVLNVAKSHYSPGPTPKGQTTIFEATPNGMKAISTTDRSDGTTTSVTTEFQFDGKEYELEGAGVKTMRTYKRTGERRVEWTNREDGKITTTTVTEVSADGKTRTLTTTGHDLKGQEVHIAAVYDRAR
jgi:hypothetical protein